MVANWSRIRLLGQRSWVRIRHLPQRSCCAAGGLCNNTEIAGQFEYSRWINQNLILNNPIWCEQGTGCEMYTETLSPSFIGMSFGQAAETGFVRVRFID